MRAPDPAPLGVVIPTLNEEAELGGLLEGIASWDLETRVVVADGGSRDGTRALARERGALVVRAPRGRGRQMNAGAAALPGSPWLLFLHADGRPDPGTDAALRRWLRETAGDTAGVFRFRLRGRRLAWRVLEAGQRLREWVAGLPYGDQGLLVARDAFQAVGGYPEIPIMEDVAMVRRLREHGVRIRSVGPAIHTSGRRYRREGPFRAWARNSWLMGLYGLGVSPERLARWYPPEPEPGAPPGNGPIPREAVGDEAGERRGPSAPALLVFAKNPRPGEVKTRLAETLGQEEAAALYRRMGREVVHRLREGGHRTEVHFSPPDQRAAVEEWLGGRGLRFIPQVEGDLGQRLREAFHGAFARGAGGAAAVGTDAPGLTPALVEEAFRRLGEADVVLGPATDGGYYLVATDRPRPELFRGIPWSTEGVLEATLERTREAGLTVALLPELRDVDRPEDLEALQDPERTSPDPREALPAE